MAPRAPEHVEAGALDALWEAVVAAKAGDALAPVTVVVASHFAAVGTRRALARHGALRGVHGVANVSFTTAADLLMALAAPALGAAGRRLAPRSVELETIRLVAAEQGGPWQRLAARPRTAAALLRAFAELRRWTPEGLEALAEHGGRGSDVVRLLVAVRSALHARGYADLLDVHSAALAAAAGGTDVVDGALVLFEPGPMAPAEAEVLHRLQAGRGGTPVVEAAPAGATEVRACADPEEEARAALRVVLAGVEAGVPLWRQALLHPGGTEYPRLLHQLLADAGVAAHGPDAMRLDRSMPGRALLGLLDLAGGDLPRDAVMAWLGAAPVVVAPGDRPAPVSRWNALSAAAGVVRGLGQWRQRLERLAARDDTARSEADALRAFVEELAQRTTPPPGGWSVRAEWAAALLGRYLDVETAGSWPDEHRVAFIQVTEAVLGLAEIDTVSPGTADLGALRRAVRAELERRPLDRTELDRGGVGDGVFVAPFGQARGLRFDTVVLVGLADAVVPGRLSEDALVPEELRRRDVSGALRTRPQRLDESLADVRAALATGTRRRVVCHPRLDTRSGRLHMPSRWLAGLAGDAVARSVDSFAASLRQPGPALGTGELTLRRLAKWARRADVLGSPQAAADAQLAVGLLATRSRLEQAFTRFDGLVGPGRVTPFDPARPVSATRFETYAECPRRFLFDRVLGISARVLPEDLWRIEARDRGSLVHAVLEQYVLERIDGAPRSLERLLTIAEGFLDEAAAGGMVGKDLLWRLDRAAIERDLRMFHAEEGDLVPLAAEFAFGEEEDGPPPVVVTLGDGRAVRFRGRADRVDRARDGAIVVSDYKTGRQASLTRLSSDPLVGGRKLQLPLYAMAARQQFGGDAPVRARYWLVSAERTAASFNVELTDELAEHFGAVVEQIATAVDAGLFPGIPGAPREGGFDGCSWCDFDRVCPATRDRQWAAKRTSVELAPVNDLVDGAPPDTLAGAVRRAATLQEDGS
jgi:RecB family exonuclease